MNLESLDIVFEFHGIMSCGAEDNFELDMKVNANATCVLLDALGNTAMVSEQSVPLFNKCYIIFKQILRR